MSRPRTSSSMRTDISPSGKLEMVTLPRGSPNTEAIFSANAMLALPLNTFSLFTSSITERGTGLLRMPRTNSAHHPVSIWCSDQVVLVKAAEPQRPNVESFARTFQDQLCHQGADHGRHL